MFAESYSDLIESQVDQRARERRERQSHRASTDPSPKDIEQEQEVRLRSLENENRRLQCYVTALVEIMRHIGVIGERQMEAIAVEAEWPKLATPAQEANRSFDMRHRA